MILRCECRPLPAEKEFLLRSVAPAPRLGARGRCRSDQTEIRDSSQSANSYRLGRQALRVQSSLCASLLTHRIRRRRGPPGLLLQLPSRRNRFGREFASRLFAQRRQANSPKVSFRQERARPEGYWPRGQEHRRDALSPGHWRKIQRRSTGTGRDCARENRAVHTSGETTWCRERGFPERGDAGLIDGADGGIRVGIGSEQSAFRVRKNLCRFLEKGDSVHARHTLIGQEQGNAIIAHLELLQQLQCAFGGIAAYDAILRAVLRAQIAFDRPQDIRVT